MNYIKISVVLAFLAFTGLVKAQQQANDPVLMTIGGKPVTKSEFLAIYNKNNNSKEAATDKKGLNEYVDLFVNFKLKVREAEEMGLDTSAAFKNELEGYRKQLAQPYLTDNEVNEKLLKEAYERLQTDVRASHILVKVDQNALPKDTLEAYNKAIAIRNRILKGESFDAVAKQVSDDPSAKDNGGDLGYFTALQMVYPFENAAFNTKIGEISQPVRTRFGYHIIKVVDKRPAQGQVLVSHIMVKLSKDAPEEEKQKAKAKIDEIYQKVKAGEDFAELAKQFSDDKGSAKKGGELPMFGTGRMVMEFEKAAFALKNNGDVSEPIQSQYGWHIIKRLDKKELAPFEEMKNELKAKISKDTRSQMGRESFIAKLQKEYKFTENLKARDEFYKVMDSTIFEGKWTADKAKKLNKTLFTLGDKTFTQQDFAKYIESHQARRAKTNTQAVVNDLYKQFKDESIIAYEESRLEQKYPEFRALMQEYRDGILLFELTDRKVWSKAVKDSAGLQEFYEKNKENFKWGERVDATIYIAANDDIAKNVRKMLKDKKKKGYTDEKILAAINKDTQLNLKIENGKFQKGENEWVDKVKWQEGISEDIKKDKQTAFVVIHKVLPPEPKTLAEARGLVTAEYQNHLEKQWIDSLKKKYNVQINQEVLSSIQ